MYFHIYASFWSFFLFNTIVLSKFSTSFAPICIPFLVNWILISFNVFELSLKIWIQFKNNLNSIQFKLHIMSFNILIWMELNFHKINSFFHQLMITGTYSTFLDYRLTKIQGLFNVKWILWETKQQPLYIYT